MAMVNQKGISNRLASASGHLSAICDMTERGEPYSHILMQLRAVKGALNKIEKQLITQHLHNCLACCDKPAIELETEILKLLALSPKPFDATQAIKPQANNKSNLKGKRYD